MAHLNLMHPGPLSAACALAGSDSALAQDVFLLIRLSLQCYFWLKGNVWICFMDMWVTFSIIVLYLNMFIYHYYDNSYCKQQVKRLSQGTIDYNWQFDKADQDVFIQGWFWLSHSFIPQPWWPGPGRLGSHPSIKFEWFDPGQQARLQDGHCCGGLGSLFRSSRNSSASACHCKTAIMMTWSDWQWTRIRPSCRKVVINDRVTTLFIGAWTTHMTSSGAMVTSVNSTSGADLWKIL